MIPELFGIMEESKPDNPATLLLTYGSTTSSPSSTPSMTSPNFSTSSTPSMTSPNFSTTSEPQQNLRCPRCDSSNTKFCYYNNYNLTQPRHFCKTCRRYWTKGGALRNVPIGGGCRKVKPCRSAAAKPKPVAGLDQEQQSPAAALWNPPYSSQLLDLLKNTQLQNPNPNLMRIKENSSMLSPHLAAGQAGAMHEQRLRLDCLGQFSVPAYNSLWRNGGNEYPYNPQQAPQQNNMFMGGIQSPSVIKELLQRLKTSANYNYGSLSSSVNPSMATGSTTTTILEPLPLSDGDVGYWNSAPPLWAELQTTNGALP